MDKKSIISLSIIGGVLLAGFIAWVAVIITAPPSQSSGKLQVVASANFWGNIASQIGGSNVEVKSIINEPGIDPHLYESNARDASALAKADIVITNGLGYDEFMDRLLSVPHNGERQVISVSSLLGAPTGANPHLWYDLPHVQQVADEFAEAIIAKDPKNKAMYQRNLVAFKDSLAQVLVVLEKIKTKFAAAPVAYTERVPEYLLVAAGLKNMTPAGFSNAVEEGNDPSPADTAAMEALLTERKIKVLFYNAQAANNVTERVRKLAKQSGIAVVGVTETLPVDEPTYQSWQMGQTTALLKALETK